MPTYEYECAKCGKTFDFFQSMKDEHLKTCINKKCKGKVKRLLGTGAGLIFKGSGFYITDYRSEGYKQAAKKDTPGGGEATKSGGGEAAKSGGGEAAKSGGGESSPSPSSGGEKPKAEKSKPTKSK